MQSLLRAFYFAILFTISGSALLGRAGFEIRTPSYFEASDLRPIKSFFEDRMESEGTFRFNEDHYAGWYFPVIQDAAFLHEVLDQAQHYHVKLEVIKGEDPCQPQSYYFVLKGSQLARSRLCFGISDGMPRDRIHAWKIAYYVDESFKDPVREASSLLWD